MKKGLLTIITILSCALAMAGETGSKEGKLIKGFSGGMMAHTGYLWGGDNPYNYSPSGTTFGIGGVARLHMSDHFRTGFEGYFSTMGLHKDVESGSHNKLFWAGALADCFWKIGRFYPYVGATVGGGMETSFYMFEGNKHDWIPEAVTVLHKQPFFAFDPFIGCDIQVGAALRLTVKADWLMAINNEGLNKPLGPRIYFGFIFAH
ncbi:MAG: hypothetical protein IKY48_04790 [Bacteroidales bacterium]|nr:hypothetical protein [Bacteroidales bacterium]